MALISDSRAEALNAFLAEAGWGDAARVPLGQDASTRRYTRLLRDDRAIAMLMDAPPIEPPVCPPDANAATRAALGWNAMTRLAASRVDAFVLIAGHLRGLGLSAPEILAHDSEAGFALIEDFGKDREFARLIERGAADETELYVAAAETLAKLHDAPVPDIIGAGGERWPLLTFDDVALRANADLYADWLPQHGGGPALSGDMRARWEIARDALVAQAEAFPRVFTLRDYHAENLLWLEDGRVGLLDFQDAVKGWDAWDLAMLTQDARRQVSEAAAEAAIARYLDLTGKSREAFDERLAIIGALNALRIAGVFARLMIRDGKPRYGDFLPRQMALLARNLEHPSTADMRAFVKEATPFVFEESL